MTQRLRFSSGKQALQLTDGRTVPYDYLVLAPGMGGTTGRPSHPTLAERRAFYFAEAERIGHAKSVLIVGGGPVGSELAGEIITEFPVRRARVLQQPALCHCLTLGDTRL